MMHKYFKTLLAFIAILLFLFICILMVKLVTKIDMDKANAKEIEYIILDKNMESSFKSSKNGLSRIDLMLRNPDLLDKNEYMVTIFDENNLMIVNRILSGFNIGDPGEFRIDFPTINNSMDKEYFIRIVPSSKIGENLKIAISKNTNKVSVNQYFKIQQNLKQFISQTVNTLLQFISTNYLALLLIVVLLIIFYSF